MGSSIAAMMAVMIPAIVSTFTKLEKFAAGHPDQVTRTVSPNGYSVTVHGNHPELMPDFGGMLIGVGVISVIVIVLLAAAVARRLHDCNRTGAWGLPPAVLLLSGLAVMSQLFGQFDDPSGPLMELFFGMFFTNMAYLGSLAVLVIMLAQPGTSGPNRFGPPPA
ncbi:MAG: DUF805 domain-containing protein [Novosphingobium sp.]|uniref:DUF805 domain-containing protein n=1 Tax=Novosphingobium sp. TaxID=1874826 RepID=UPI0032BCCEFA